MKLSSLKLGSWVIDTLKVPGRVTELGDKVIIEWQETNTYKALTGTYDLAASVDRHLLSLFTVLS